MLTLFQIYQFMAEKKLNGTVIVTYRCNARIETKPVRDVPVEVHVRPSFMNEPAIGVFSNCLDMEVNVGRDVPAWKRLMASSMGTNCKSGTSVVEKTEVVEVVRAYVNLTLTFVV